MSNKIRRNADVYMLHCHIPLNEFSPEECTTRHKGESCQRVRWRVERVYKICNFSESYGRIPDERFDRSSTRNGLRSPSARRICQGVFAGNEVEETLMRRRHGNQSHPRDSRAAGNPISTRFHISHFGSDGGPLYNLLPIATPYKICLGSVSFKIL